MNGKWLVLAGGAVDLIATLPRAAKGQATATCKRNKHHQQTKSCDSSGLSQPHQCVGLYLWVGDRPAPVQQDLAKCLGNHSAEPTHQKERYNRVSDPSFVRAGGHQLIDEDALQCDKPISVYSSSAGHLVVFLPRSVRYFMQIVKLHLGLRLGAVCTLVHLPFGVGMIL